MIIFSVSFMNEFSHLLESQNSVIITDLLLCFSHFPPIFYNQIPPRSVSAHQGNIFIFQIENILNELCEHSCVSI